MSDQTKREGRFKKASKSGADLNCVLDAAQYSTLTLRARTLKLPGNVQVFADQTPVDAVYLLKRGRAGLVNCGFRSVLTEPGGAHQVFFLLETLSKTTGDGELRTITPCEFGIVDGDDLFQFLRDQPSVCFSLAQSISRLYQVTVRLIAEN